MGAGQSPKGARGEKGRRGLKRFQAKWMPVRVKKTRKNRKAGAGFRPVKKNLGAEARLGYKERIWGARPKGPAPPFFSQPAHSLFPQAAPRRMIRDEVGTLMANPFKFLQEVRAEANKVTWPTRRETMITTGLVALMVVMAAIFFVSVDQVIRLAVGFILGFGH
jgi:preprotein translocase subunit SecE